MAFPGRLTLAELFGGAMLLIGGLVLLVSARYVWRATAVLRGTDQTELNPSHADTLKRISGDVTLNDDTSLVAPFSGTGCVAFRYQIEERRLSVLYLLPWDVTVHEGTGAVAFDVQTDAGTVSVVEPARTVALTTDVVTTTGPPPPPRSGHSRHRAPLRGRAFATLRAGSLYRVVFVCPRVVEGRPE